MNKMLTKYGFEIEGEVGKKSVIRLINQVWKLIPMRENNEDWKKHLQVIIGEISGFYKIFGKELDFIILLSKLEGLPQIEDFDAYKMTVFRCINIIGKVKQEFE